ncbi:MAG: hypothetical protein Q4G18_13335, partial [Myroides sp.]|nr:hypothetical protein [Myroides sp.]
LFEKLSGCVLHMQGTHIGFAKWRFKGNIESLCIFIRNSFLYFLFSYFSKYKKAVAQVSVKSKVLAF